MKFTLIIPVINELNGMKVVMPQIKREWMDQIIFVDGGSTDGTVEWAREQGYFVHVQQKRGMRHAYNEVLRFIEGDYVITFSPDGNCLPQDIPALIAKVKEGDYDMVIASRYLGGAKSEDDDIVTGFGNWLFTGTVNLLFGGSYTDAMGIFRAYRTELIYELELDRDRWYRTPEALFCTNLSWEPMLSARAARRGYKIAEILGFEPARIGGERKLQIIRWGAGYYFQFLRDWLFWR